VLVTNWQQFTSTFGDMVEDYALAKSIYGFFNNGGGRAYVVRISTGADATESPVAELGTKADKKIPALRVKALEAGGPNVSVQVQAAPGGEEGAEPNYTVTIKAGDETETFTGTVGKGKNNLATQVNTKSKLVKIEAIDAPAELVASGLNEGTVVLATPANLPVNVEAAALIGDSRGPSGSAALPSGRTASPLPKPRIEPGFFGTLVIWARSAPNLAPRQNSPRAKARSAPKLAPRQNSLRAKTTLGVG
jgi:hypothetical protein